MEDDITVTINGKIHKLIYSDNILPCRNCSLYSTCRKLKLPTPCVGLGGSFFVELKIEK